MPYPYDQIFAADPASPENVASNGVVTIFAPGDPSRAPLTITTLDGLPLSNPVQVNDAGFGPAFMHATLDQVAWEGGGFSGLFVSYKGMKDEAVAARRAAEAAALEAGAPTDAMVDRGIQRADIPSAVAQAIAADGTVTAAAGAAVDSAIAGKRLVESHDSRLPRQDTADELVAVVVDAAQRETWLGARLSDGGPSDWAMRHLNQRLGVELGSAPGYLAALTDSNGRMTDLSIRAADGQFADFVVKRLAGRIEPHLSIPGGGAAPTAPSTEPPVDPAAGAVPAMVPLLQSIANAAGRNAAGAPLRENPYDFIANGQDARLTFPTRYTDATPMPLLIQFEGVGATSIDPRPTLREPVRSVGALYAHCKFHGDSYGSLNAMADARAIYEHALRIAPISGVILFGNSMGGIGALNALHTGTIPNVLGVYLTDPTYDLAQRYNGGRANEVKAAYGIASDGSDYATKTKGYDPALAPVADFRGVPMRIVSSSGDTTVPLALHGRKLAEKLAGSNEVNILDIGDAGHNTPARFIPSDLTAFITKVCGGSAGLRA